MTGRTSRPGCRRSKTGFSSRSKTHFSCRFLLIFCLKTNVIRLKKYPYLHAPWPNITASLSRYLSLFRLCDFASLKKSRLGRDRTDSSSEDTDSGEKKPKKKESKVKSRLEAQVGMKRNGYSMKQINTFKHYRKRLWEISAATKVKVIKINCKKS